LGDIGPERVFATQGSEQFNFVTAPSEFVNDHIRQMRAFVRTDG
jgi:hypothetical protein